MAKSKSTSTQRKYGASASTKALRTLTWLLIIILGIAGLNWIAVAFQGGQWTPRLALDLEGGTQVVLEAQLPEGAADPSAEQMQQAVSIIRQRVDAAGVTEAEITTQGGRNIVVAVPGEMDDATRDRIESSARLDFRPVLVADSAANMQIIPPEMLPDDLTTAPTAEPTDPSDLSQVYDTLYVDFLGFDCAAAPPASESSPTEPLIACDATGTQKFILGPVEVQGADISDASHGLAQTSMGATTNEWTVNIQFNAAGTEAFAAMTQRLYGLTGAQNQFAATLDNVVIVAPTTDAIITDGRPSIKGGNMTEERAKTLADQLKFGALPFNFETQSSETISATLGTSQLISGLIAGLIGLALVVVYSVFQYRVLGLVTIASLVVSGVIAYLVVTYLSNQEGYRLSLAGVAGLIVAIGITADSFIVYFERIKDELRDGKSLPSAVEAGWARAFRTIVVSDAVNFLVAVVLFFIAVGNVRGFALTLGLTTLIDVLVVTMFTHPVMRLLAKTRFFGGGHPASGLDPRALGAVYRGRGSFRISDAERRSGAAREAQRRRTLAERKAAEARGETLDDEIDDEDATTTSKRKGRLRSRTRARGKRGAEATTGTLTKERDEDDTDLDDDLEDAALDDVAADDAAAESDTTDVEAPSDDAIDDGAPDETGDDREQLADDDADEDGAADETEKDGGEK